MDMCRAVFLTARRLRTFLGAAKRPRYAEAAQRPEHVPEAAQRPSIRQDHRAGHGFVVASVDCLTRPRSGRERTRGRAAAEYTARPRSGRVREVLARPRSGGRVGLGFTAKRSGFLILER